MNVAVVIGEILWGFALCFYYAGIGLLQWIKPEKFCKSVQGEIVLITGAGSGIGRLIAQRLAELGAIIVTWDVNEKGNKETVQKIISNGGRAFAYTVDLGSRHEIYKAAEQVRDEVGVVTMLINNAGIVSGLALMDTPDSKIMKTFDVNVLAHFWTIKAFLPGMIESKKGHIVNVASMAGFSGINKLVDYCASKFAAVGLDEALRVELKVRGHSSYIKTTAICPYYISTGMFAGVQSKIIPILEPEFVADQSVLAIRTNKEIVCLPWWCCFLVTLKTILPTKGSLYLSQVFGLNCAMDEFQGRTK